MNKMRVNILTPIPFWHPGTQELINGLRENNIEVVCLDIWELRYFDQNNRIHNLIPSIFKGFSAKIYRNVFRRKVIKKHIHENDIVDIQWCGYYYSKYIDLIKKQSNKIIASPFGSDVLRATKEERKIQKKIFNTALAIVLGRNWADTFISYFPEAQEKLRFNQFGSARFDMINEFWSPENKRKLRIKYQIPEHKIAVTIGYSANPLQQHLLFIDMLKQADLEIKEKLFLIVPLTYGLNKNEPYYINLKRTIAESGIEFLLFENHLSDMELCESKIISDITVSLQTTDTQSSSIKEAFAAKNIVMAGDWLPYEFYEELGIFIKRSNLENFYADFIEIIKNFDDYYKKSEDNSDKVGAFVSWKLIVPRFINVYKEIKYGRN